MRDEDVELVLDRGDEIHHRQAVPFEVLGEAVASVTATPFLLNGSISVAILASVSSRSVMAVRSGRPGFRNAMGRECGEGRGEMVLRMRAVDIVEDAEFVPIEAVSADEAMHILESRDDNSLLFTESKCRAAWTV